MSDQSIVVPEGGVVQEGGGVSPAGATSKSPALSYPYDFDDSVKLTQPDDYVTFTKDGCPAIRFSDEVMARAEAFTAATILILNFKEGRPSLSNIRANIESEWGVSSNFTVGLIDAQHVLIRFSPESAEEDVPKALARKKLYIKGYWFTIQRWSPSFEAERRAKIIGRQV